MTTLNGVYELTYFRYTLGVSQLWRERRGLAPDANATKVLATMCLPQKRQWKNETVYFFTDASTELIGNATALGQVYACAHMPCMSAGIDRETMRSTLRLSVDEFNFNNAYPGDDRAYAMAAARLGDADIALEMLLKKEPTNAFNEKNGQWQGFFPLLTSSNGQLMYAIAMLAGGWDDGGGVAWPSGWNVTAEGFPQLLTDDEAALAADDSAADTGAQCTTVRDCALNGRCVQGSCVCTAAWSGAKDCSALAFTPAKRASGYVRAPPP